VNVTVNSTLSTIAVSPNIATVSQSATQQFGATGRDQFGNAMSAAVTWSIAGGGGSVNSSGLYTAPTNQGGVVSVRAASGAVSGVAVVTVPMDNTDTSGVTYVGTWTGSTTVGGYLGTNYSYYNTTGGSGSATYTPNIPQAGQYAVFARWTSQANRNVAVPIDVTSAAGTTTTIVNQQNNGSAWNSLGTYTFNFGTGGNLKIRTPADVNPNASVIADGVMFQLVRATPTVVKAAAATPAPVTGTTAVLSVLGGDIIAGESDLTYTWNPTSIPVGAAAPIFSASGTNAAKNTLVTFSKPGNYSFTVTIANSVGLSTTSNVTVLVASPGDANADGIVNSADFTVLAMNFNQTGRTWQDGDFNADGNVNALDFNAIASNFGQPAPAGAVGESSGAASGSSGAVSALSMPPASSYPASLFSDVTVDAKPDDVLSDL
jgi:hypothetical protein